MTQEAEEIASGTGCTVRNATTQKQVLNFMLQGRFSSLTLTPKGAVRVSGSKAIYEDALSQFIKLKIVSVK